MSAERERSVDRGEDSTEGQDLERATGGAKRTRGDPSLTDEQEMSIIDFVKEHPELYSRENAR